ncbi:MAG: hypothetical protein KF705_06775 [Phycisphaeraceae bacterium]|nr:hypothetical protein [Phycisphaeraceae bacterium]
MSKKTKTTKPASTNEISANDKARADALAKLNAKAPATATDAPATPTAATTVAQGAKPAKGGGKNAKAAKGTPTGEPRATGGKTAKGAKDAKARSGASRPSTTRVWRPSAPRGTGKGGWSSSCAACASRQTTESPPRPISRLRWERIAVGW